MRRAWRQRCLELHPDSGGERLGGSTEELEMVHAAWRVLGDAEKRREYEERDGYPRRRENGLVGDSEAESAGRKFFCESDLDEFGVKRADDFGLER